MTASCFAACCRRRNTYP